MARHYHSSAVLGSSSGNGSSTTTINRGHRHDDAVTESVPRLFDTAALDKENTDSRLLSTGQKRSLEEAEIQQPAEKRCTPLGDVRVRQQQQQDIQSSASSYASAESSRSHSDDDYAFIDAHSSPRLPSSPIPDAFDDEHSEHLLTGLLSDPAHCREYAARIMEYSRDLEMRRQPRPSYMSRQHDINVTMRAMLIDWLVDVMEEFNLQHETLFLTVNIIDRFLSMMRVTRGRLQLVGIASMLVASKCEEIQPPRVDEFVFIADNTYRSDELLAMEYQILKSLQFNLNTASPLFFANRFLLFVHADDQTRYLVNFLLELGLLEYRLLNFVPSEIAAAAVVLALHTLNKPFWSQSMQAVSGYALHDLQDECIPLFFTLFVNSSVNTRRAIHEKYARPQYMSVSLLSPRGTIDSILV